MSKASGIVLIAAGIAVAAYVLPSGELTEADFARDSDVTKPPASDNANRVVIVPPEPKPAIRPQQAARSRYRPSRHPSSSPSPSVQVSRPGPRRCRGIATPSAASCRRS
jgi:hypothetical protein